MPGEADDDLEVPFKIEDQSGEPQEPSDEAKKALGLKPEDVKPPAPTDDAQKKSEREGKKLVDTYSSKIQEKAEELYVTEERLALRDPAHLDKLLSSTDKVDRKNAEKILKRNSEHFKATSPDEYKMMKAKKAAGDDPVRQQLVEMNHEIASLKKERSSTEWKEWKLENSIKGNLSKVADEVYSEYPDLPFTDIFNLAKGRAGVRSPSSPGKQEASTAIGGGMPTVTEEIDPALKSKFRIRPETEKFAKSYLGY